MHFLRVCLFCLAGVVVLTLAGCVLYHVPLSERLSPEKHAQAVAWEKEARRNGWDGVWDARIHSLDT